VNSKQRGGRFINDERSQMDPLSMAAKKGETGEGFNRVEEGDRTSKADGKEKKPNTESAI